MNYSKNYNSKIYTCWQQQKQKVLCLFKVRPVFISTTRRKAGNRFYNMKTKNKKRKMHAIINNTRSTARTSDQLDQKIEHVL